MIPLKPLKLSLLIAVLALMSGCVDPELPQGQQVPYLKQRINYAPVLDELKSLEAPKRKINISVYNFPDLTGAFKPNDNYASYSKAVPQGAEAMVVDALIAAGNGSWFSVTERQGLQSLVQERRIVEVALDDQKNRTQVMNNFVNKIKERIEKQKKKDNSPDLLKNNNDVLPESGAVEPGKGSGILANPNNQMANGLMGKQPNPPTMQDIPALPSQMYIPPLNPSEYIIEGGIIGYDSDVVTSGAGLKIMNIGGFGEVRKDTVSVNMRLVNVNTGRVVLSTTLTKGIFSQKLQGSGMGYVSIDRILEAEGGIGYNEPVFEALNLTIQSAVLDIVKKAQSQGIW
jgi:curli biogenesis system outer membrane secretion channel CsgG